MDLLIYLVGMLKQQQQQNYSVVLPNVKRLLSLTAGSMSICNGEGTAARRDGPILGTRSILELD